MIEAPAIARRVFDRLCRGDNLLLSSNGPGEDAELYRQLQANEEGCRDYFAVIGIHLHEGDNFFYCTAEQEQQTAAELKLEKVVRAIRMLDFFSSYIDSFGEGVIFSSVSLAARCSGDPRSERFLQDAGRGETYVDRLDSLLQTLARQGYLSEHDGDRKEYRVLSAINYLFEFAERIVIRDNPPEEQEHGAA